MNGEGIGMEGADWICLAALNIGHRGCMDNCIWADCRDQVLCFVEIFKVDLDVTTATSGSNNFASGSNRCLNNVRGN